MPRTKVNWFGSQVTRSLQEQTLLKLGRAGKFVRDKTRANISIDVERLPSGNVIRSKPGEFPRRDTTRLYRTLRHNLYTRTLEVRVESPEPYALTLEQNLDRAFLTRTLREELPAVRTIMTSPINLQGG